MRYINELREGENVNGIYYCKAKQNLKTKAGKSYYSMSLQDKTGILDAKVWDLSNAIEHFEDNDYIQVVGQITSFQGNLQMNISRVRRASEGEYDINDYMPVTSKNREEMYKELGAGKNTEKIEQLLNKFVILLGTIKLSSVSSYPLDGITFNDEQLLNIKLGLLMP